MYQLLLPSLTVDIIRNIGHNNLTEWDIILWWDRNINLPDLNTVQVGTQAA